MWAPRKGQRHCPCQGARAWHPAECLLAADTRQRACDAAPRPSLLRCSSWQVPRRWQHSAQLWWATCLSGATAPPVSRTCASTSPTWCSSALSRFRTAASRAWIGCPGVKHWPLLMQAATHSAPSCFCALAATAGAPASQPRRAGSRAGLAWWQSCCPSSHGSTWTASTGTGSTPASGLAQGTATTLTWLQTGTRWQRWCAT